VTRVVVADDRALVRAGVKTVLQAEPDIDVVGEATACGRSCSRTSMGS
jgi:DNA-binding NarL/FixJ family response regulator